MALPAMAPLGSTHAFEQVYRRHVSVVWRALWRFGVDRADLEDAVQDVFLVVHRRRDALLDETKTRAWLLGICRRVASEHRRRSGRHRRRIEELRRQAPQSPEPDDTLRLARGAQLVQRFLASLDERNRAMFVMVELEQFSTSDAARSLGLNRNTAAARLRVARRSFERYAEQVRCSPSKLVASSDEGPAPDSQTRRRMLGLLLVRISKPGASLVPVGAWFGAGAKTIPAVVGAAALGGVVMLGVGTADDAPSRAAAVTPRAEDPTTKPSVNAVVPVASPPTQTPPLPSASAPAVVDAVPARVRRRPSPTDADVTPAAEDPLTVQSHALAKARALLQRGRPGDALSRVDEVLQQFPSGALVVELRVARVGALCALGKGAQARAEAALLRRRHPGSLVAERAVCPEGPPATPDP
ncbi:MAG: sigma-70 family RNA polymerase sigma factor [Myxococcota bacterium]